MRLLPGCPMTSEADNSVSLLTPAGPGAVAVLGLHISDQSLLPAVFAPFRRHHAAAPTEYHQLPLNRMLFGSWHSEDLLLTRTAPARWEIHCHGGIAAVRRILEHLSCAGLQVISSPAGRQSGAGQLPRVSSDEPAPELLRTLVEHAVRTNLSACRTRTAADWVLRQLDGRLQKALTRLCSADPETSRLARTELAQHQRFTSLLLRPIRVGLFGPPNAGKSSLLNALCGRERAIVSPQPGTTRDTVAAEIQASGWALSVNDTAGLNQQPDSPLESQGIRKSLAAVAQCDAACILVPVDQPLPDLLDLNRQFEGCLCRILVLSRSDLPLHMGNHLPDDATAAAAGFNAVVQTSAFSGRGLDQLLKAVLQHVLPPLPEVSAALPLPGIAADRLFMDHTEHSSWAATQ